LGRKCSVNQQHSQPGVFSELENAVSRQVAPRRSFLRISEIRLDFQSPSHLMEETVEEYVRRMRQGDRLEPVRVRFDGTNYYCENGFHRLEAARRIGRKRIKAQILKGTPAKMEAGFQKFLKALKKSLRDPAHMTRVKR
jgi:uncharacterized ParB-like nuclease family protein